MPDLFVIFDTYAWSTEIPGRPDRTDYHVARQGEKISVSDAEADRGLALGALSRSPAVAEAAVAANAEPPSWSDVELDSANVEDTVAYLAQHPSEATRVLALEASRPKRELKTRKGVTDAAERIDAAYQEQLEADAAAREAAEDEEQRAYAASTGATSTVPRIP